MPILELQWEGKTSLKCLATIQKSHYKKRIKNIINFIFAVLLLIGDTFDICLIIGVFTMLCRN